jgi:hypothetical protein
LPSGISFFNAGGSRDASRRGTVRRFAPNKVFALRPSAEERIPSCGFWGTATASTFRVAFGCRAGRDPLSEGFAFRFSIFSAERESQREGFALRQNDIKGTAAAASTRVHQARTSVQASFKPGASLAQTSCAPLLILDSRSTLMTWHSGIAS